MSDLKSPQLLNGFLGKLYDELTMGDDQVMRSANDFFSWITPGIPYSADNFDFQERGFVPTHLGVSGTEDQNEDGEPQDVDLEKLKRELGAEKLRMYIQAEDLAYLMDFIPDASGISDGDKRMNLNKKIWNPSDRLSDVYNFVLNQSEVVQTEVDETLQAKIDRVRRVLQTTKTVTDFDENFEEVKREITVDSVVAVQYKEKKQVYDAAFQEYRNAQIRAMNGGPEDVDFFALNERILRSKVRMAENDWHANGYKNLYERATSFLDQAASGDLNLLMQGYREDMDFSQISNPASPGSKFYFTKLVPSNFASSMQGWTQFSFSKKDYESHRDRRRTTWGAGGGFIGGLFNIGGSAEGEVTRISNDVKWESLKIKFSIAQVPIMRSWFHSNLLSSRFWRFGANADIIGQGDLLSDGGMPPAGQMPAYPTTAIFIKDLEITFDTYSGNYDALHSHISGRSGLSWGPIHLGGSYSRSKTTSDFESSRLHNGIKIDGMQLIGFRCHLLPKSPNPVEGIAEENWA